MCAAFKPTQYVTNMLLTCQAVFALQGTALCVDIQGVGDLYTDPQIHTLDGVGYGDGNLALRGM
jgi:hypothetical protein